MAVLNKHHGGIPAGAIYIGRGSPWGNPFVIGKDGDRNQVIAKHRQHLWHQLKTGAVTVQALAELQGKDLVCFCAPAPCHGHTLEVASAWAKHKLGEG